MWSNKKLVRIYAFLCAADFAILGGVFSIQDGSINHTVMLVESVVLVAMSMFFLVMHARLYQQEHEEKKAVDGKEKGA